MKDLKTLNKKFYENEIKLAAMRLSKEKEDRRAKARLSYALAYLGDYTHASNFAPSSKSLNIVDKFSARDATNKPILKSILAEIGLQIGGKGSSIEPKVEAGSERGEELAERIPTK